MNRLFIALPAPADSAAKLDEIMSLLNKHTNIFKPVSKENFHITMKFLGEVKEPALTQLIESFKKIDISEKGIPYTLKGLGMFKNQGGGVVWAGIQTDMEPVKRVFGLIEAFAFSFGFERERRNFKPHLTLARFRNPAAMPEDISEHIKENRDTEYCGGLFDKVRLYNSTLKPSGPVYDMISEVNFKG